MEVNVEIVLSYNDEETDWKVKKNISRFIYRLKKYRTGNRFSGEYIHIRLIKIQNYINK